MSKKTIHVKNMVCDRCKLVVRETLESMGLEVEELELGKAVVKGSGVDQRKIDEALQEYGFELLQGRDQQLVERVKNLLVEYVKSLQKEEALLNISDFLVKHLNQSYSKISSAFSRQEDITIEKYLIHLKIERVKELLSYGEMTLSEIAYLLNYSSVAHLSTQFKQVTGMSVTDYKKARDTFRKSLDKVDE